MKHVEYSKSDYRAEIDGLRAFAILSVVVYHAFPMALTGGFTGVDVFFVISGYLITAHVFASLDSGGFSFTKFLGKRIRRLFPALILVMLSSLAFGWFALVSYELQQLGKHVASGAAFIVNFVLVGEAGYFDTAAEKKPMLHLWSLAVEEQFYFVWPLVLFLAWKLRFNILLVTLLVATASFYLNIRFVESNPTEVFFWPFGRFWELLCGSVLAWLTRYRGEVLYRAKTSLDEAITHIVASPSSARTIAFTENAMALCGLGLLVFGFLGISADKPYPSTWAFVPVGGAMLVIAAGPKALSNRLFMMNPVAVWFGLISYPLYLWHWPILSFLRIVEGGETPHRDAQTAGVVLAIGLAWLTVRFVERPLRFGRANVRLKIAGLIFAMTCCGLTGLVISRSDLTETRGFDDPLIKRPGREHIYGKSAEWYYGKDDWLFLGNAHSNTVEKLKLARLPDPESVERERTRFEQLAEAAATRNAAVILLIGPNKSSVYPEFLPDELLPSHIRYVASFIESLGSIRNVTVIDPTAELVRTKQRGDLLYYRTDTHWNLKGGLETFETMAERMGWPIPHVSFADEKPRSGDLIGISGLEDFPLSTGDNWRIEWTNEPVLERTPLPRAPETPFGFAGIVRNEAPLSERTVWVIGDSFVGAVAPYLDATFKEVHYLGHWSSEIDALPANLLRSNYPPDVILVVRVERSF